MNKVSSINRFGLRYEVTGKVEAAGLENGNTKFTLHGRLSIFGIDSANEPLNLALPVPRSIFDATVLGDVLVFDWDAELKTVER